MFSREKKLPAALTVFLFVLSFAIVNPAFSVILPDEPEEEQEQEDTITFPFPDEELIDFFDANREISEMRREMQERMAETVEEQGLTLERFNQIARANQIGALQGGTFSDEEIEAFNTLGPQISQIQREQQQLVSMILEEKGFSNSSYQDILNEYRQDEQLQAHVRELLRERRRQEILEERRKEAERKAKEGEEGEEEEEGEE